MGTVDGLARAVGRAAEAVRIGARTVTPLDTNPVSGNWRHITKIDPEDEKQLPLLYPLYLRHTSAVSVGGSSDVNSRNTEETFTLLDYADVPVFHEPSAARHVTERTREASDFLAIPEVLNGDSSSLIGTLGEGTAYLRDELVPGLLDADARWLPAGVRRRFADFLTSWLLARAVFEAYIIQNPESAAAREANVTAGDVLTPTQAAQRALAAERHLGSEVIYVEYSGRFGGDEGLELLEAVSASLSWSRLWYGGGVAAREQSQAVLAAGADAVVVGNVFHDIAAEELDLCTAAQRAFDDDPGEPAVRDWLAEMAEVDIDTSSATRYLATTPGVADPAALAGDYLTATVRTHLGLSGLLREASDTVGDAAGLHQFIGDRDAESLPGSSYLAGRTANADLPLERAYALYYLAHGLGVQADTLPLDHIGPLTAP